MDENKIIKTEAHQPSPVGQTRFQYLAVRFKGKFSLKHTFAALKYPNYNLWFRGQIISLFGTWMQTTAEGFLVFELTHSPAFLGYVGFATGIPAWLFMFYGGVIADRIPRRKVIVITQTTRGNSGRTYFCGRNKSLAYNCTGFRPRYRQCFRRSREAVVSFRTRRPGGFN